MSRFLLFLWLIHPLLLLPVLIFSWTFLHLAVRPIIVILSHFLFPPHVPPPPHIFSSLNHRHCGRPLWFENHRFWRFHDRCARVHWIWGWCDSWVWIWQQEWKYRGRSSIPSPLLFSPSPIQIIKYQCRIGNLPTFTQKTPNKFCSFQAKEQGISSNFSFRFSDINQLLSSRIFSLFFQIFSSSHPLFLAWLILS